MGQFSIKIVTIDLELIPMKNLKVLLYSLAIILFVLSIGKFLFWYFPLELLTHFQIYYLWFSITLSLILTICWWRNKLRDRGLIYLALSILVFNLFDIYPWYFSRANIATNGAKITLMSFNINVENTQTSAIVRSIRSVNPDVVVVIEVTPPMMANINAEIKSVLPYNFRSPGGGLGIFSKLPLQSPRGEKFNGSDANNLVTTIAYQNREIKIIGAHPLVPIKRDRFVNRNQHLQSIGNYLKNTRETVILLGDFNLTPWSPYYRKLISSTGLHNSRLGFGILPTWIRPATHVKYPALLIPFVNIPIDHIFVSKDINVARTYIGDNGNSDHAPIISELVL
jgi:endonuclease/exonuclease/phosphatase (EEP) superfamily protein YafD